MSKNGRRGSEDSGIGSDNENNEVSWDKLTIEQRRKIISEMSGSSPEPFSDIKPLKQKKLIKSKKIDNSPKTVINENDDRKSIDSGYESGNEKPSSKEKTWQDQTIEERRAIISKMYGISPEPFSDIKPLVPQKMETIKSKPIDRSIENDPEFQEIQKTLQNGIKGVKAQGVPIEEKHVESHSNGHYEDPEDIEADKDSIGKPGARKTGGLGAIIKKNQRKSVLVEEVVKPGQVKSSDTLKKKGTISKAVGKLFGGK